MRHAHARAVQREDQAGQPTSAEVFLDEEDDAAMGPRRASPDIGPTGHVNQGSSELEQTTLISLAFAGFATYRFVTSETCVPPDFQFATPGRRKARDYKQ